MLKRLLLFFFSVSAVGLMAQTMVTTMPQHSAVVLEEYTGIYCQFCPDGHKRAKELKADYPGRVVLVNIHQGGYANPQGNDPDFRTAFGNDLAGQTNLTGYPTGTINREIFPQFGSTMAMSRSNWRLAGEQVLERKAPVNLGATSSYNATSRTLTVNVEAFYTEDAQNSYNLLNVALIQDSILGPQTGAATWNPGDLLNGQYVHGHMLRHLITGQWGDTIANTNDGDLFSATYNYVLPDSINGVPLVADNCHLAVYLTEDRTHITQGISLGMNDANDGNHSPVYSEITNLNTNFLDGNSGSTSSFNFDLASNFSTNEDFKVELTAEAPSDWSVSYDVDGTTYTGNNTIQLSGSSPASFSLDVVPGSTAALAHYALKIYPLSDTSSYLRQEFYVASGITDLVVNGTGGFGDGNSYSWESIYKGGLNAAGVSSVAVTDADIMEYAFSQGGLSDVNNLYLNIGWTFPSLSDDQATALMNFLDNGGNLLIAGQDIGWDIKSGSGYGTPVTNNFYTNYLNADYQADGGGGNSGITAVATDNIFGNVGNSSLSQPYGSNFYPDELQAVGKGQAIFNYTGTSKVAGVRAYDGFKVVYLGVGLEMISDASVANDILDLSYQWFNGLISVAEFDFLARGFEVYPNPGEGDFELSLPLEGDYQLAVYNATGQLVMTEAFSPEALNHKISLKEVPAGMYLFTLHFGSKSITKKVSIK